MTASQTYEVQYVGPAAIVSALAQALTEQGVSVEYERPEESRGVEQIAQEVAVNLACSGAWAAIVAGVHKFRATRLGSAAKVKLPEAEDDRDR